MDNIINLERDYFRQKPHEKREAVANYAASCIGRVYGEPSAAHEWCDVMSNDAVYAKWCEKYEEAERKQQRQ